MLFLRRNCFVFMRGKRFFKFKFICGKRWFLVFVFYIIVWLKIYIIFMFLFFVCYLKRFGKFVLLFGIVCVYVKRFVCNCVVKWVWYYFVVFRVKFCDDSVVIGKSYCWKYVFNIFSLYFLFYDRGEIFCGSLIYV